ncbi:TetR/AcrR family transcriptional regulator [Mollicutes bacterium LVI A0039]|nr:TetR/AcrR family transcriptional regulator [Mollicutes bacterium LVI A0039]
MELQKIIYENSKRLFREKGYDKTTLSEIIDASDCSKGGFYHYYKSKEDIIPQVLDEYEQVYIDCINAFVLPEKSGYENLLKFYETVYLDNSEKARLRKELYDIIVQIDRGDLYRHMRKRADGALTKMVCELLEKGEIDGSVELNVKPIIIAKLFAREFRYFDERMRKLIVRYNIESYEQAQEIHKTILLEDEMELSIKLLESTINRELPLKQVYIDNFKILIDRGIEHIKS